MTIRQLVLKSLDDMIEEGYSEEKVVEVCARCQLTGLCLPEDRLRWVELGEHSFVLTECPFLLERRER